MNLKAHTNLIQRTNKQVKLRVLHDHTPPIPKDKIPPCDDCKTAACCHAFVVPITRQEYESGLYGDVAVEITPEQARQLQGRTLLPIAATSPVMFRESLEKTQYYLEGRIGEPCPFLVNSRCSIYEDRPTTCRVYTCVGDERITQEMRDGTIPPLTGILAALQDKT